MKLLVIGAQGQLARSLSTTAKFHDMSIVAVGRPELDLLNATTIFHTIDRLVPDVVINTAAYTFTDRAEVEQPKLAYAINAEGAGRVAEACARRNIPLIHISTDYVFGGSLTGPYRESDTASPVNIYGHSKLEGEHRVAELAHRHIILRTAWVYSTVGRNFVKTMLQLAESRSELSVVNDQFGSPTYAPYLAAGILTIARQIQTNRESPWGIYHSAGGGETTWFDLAQAVFSQSERLGGPTARLRPISRMEYATLAKRPADSRLDCSKCARVFGVRMPDWRIGVADCVRRLVEDKAEH